MDAAATCPTAVVIEKNGTAEYSYVTSPDGSTVHGWTASSNLYSRPGHGGMHATSNPG